MLFRSVDHHGGGGAVPVIGFSGGDGIHHGLAGGILDLAEEIRMLLASGGAAARASHKIIRDPLKPAQIFSETPFMPDAPATAAPSALEAVKRSRGADVSAERSRSISSGDASEKSTPAQERGAGDAGFADGVQEAATADLHFEAKGEVITFDGFLRVYGGGKDELLPKLHTGDTLETHDITARQTFARPPARYTEGSLVKKLEDLSIGRPSTYATIKIGRAHV